MPSLGQEKKSIKAVLDTNVLISAYLFKNKLGPIADLVQADRIRPAFIVSTFAELEKVLAYPKFLIYMRRQETTPEKILAEITPKSTILPDPDNIPKVVTHVGDNAVLAAALTANVDLIVTGDAELLDLKTYKYIPIIHPLDFLKDHASKNWTTIYKIL